VAGDKSRRGTERPRLAWPPPGLPEPAPARAHAVLGFASDAPLFRRTGRPLAPLRFLLGEGAAFQESRRSRPAIWNPVPQGPCWPNPTPGGFLSGAVVNGVDDQPADAAHGQARADRRQRHVHKAGDGLSGGFGEFRPAIPDSWKLCSCYSGSRDSGRSLAKAVRCAQPNSSNQRPAPVLAPLSGFFPSLFLVPGPKMAVNQRACGTAATGVYIRSTATCVH